MVKVIRDRCGYCGSCVGACPQGAIKMIDLFVQIDREKCVACELCIKVCPLGALMPERGKEDALQTSLWIEASNHTN